jgi:nucleoside phosphorylase
MNAFYNYNVTKLCLVIIAAIISAGSMPAASIAYFFALDQDLEALIKAGAVSTKVETVGDRTLHSLRLGQHTVVATKLQSGQVESAVSAQAILSRRAFDAVISCGVVGALDNSHTPGTIVSVNAILAWQTGSMGPGGWNETPRSRPEITLWQPLQLDLPWAGTASGDVFIASDAERARLYSTTGMPLVDMNLHGLQVAINSHRLPAIHLRIVSDRASDSAGEEFRRFAKDYDGALGRSVGKLLQMLPMDPEAPLSYPALRLLEQQP